MRIVEKAFKLPYISIKGGLLAFFLALLVVFSSCGNSSGHGGSSVQRLPVLKKPTAICRDGTYSYSQTHQGTCSHHGGVAEWLD